MMIMSVSNGHKPQSQQGLNGDIEGFLWLLLVSIVLIHDITSISTLVAWLHAVYRTVLPSQSISFLEGCWRRRQSHGVKGDREGTQMAIVLLPTLLRCMAKAAPWHEEWNDYARATSLCLLCLEDPIISLAAWGVATGFQPTLLSTKCLFFVATWIVGLPSLQLGKSLHGVFTFGEWAVLSNLLSIVVTECVLLPPLPKSDLFMCVAVSGFVGCLLVFTTIDYIARTWLYLRILLLVVIPLVCVEGSFVFQGQSVDLYRFPRPLRWIKEFLLSDTEPMLDGIPPVPRVTWLVFWAVSLLVFLPLAPSSEKTSTVITRKYFHLVAVVLFGPVTVAAPKLQSLGFAIALSLLMVLECVRYQIPMLDAFFERYLDASKGEGVNTTMVMTHMALIVGCAVPLWLVQCLDGDQSSGQLSILDQWAKVVVALWGVIVLGVGDAVGAVIGYNFGKVGWGQGRTVEGSLAMLFSTLVCCYGIAGWSKVQLYAPACLFATLLEAFTTQIDNMVLPLAGATVMIFMAEKEE